MLVIFREVVVELLYELSEDGQRLRPKISKHQLVNKSVVQEVGVKFYIRVHI
jgi:hypothetical protein